MIKYILLTITVAIGAFAAAFFAVDKRIVSRLENRKMDHIPAVYSDVFELRSGSPIAAAVLADELGQRGYRALPTSPQKPGEFSQNGDSFEIFSRGFLGADGSNFRPKLAVLNTQTGAIHLAGGIETSSLILEPKVLSYLGSGDQRASNFKALTEIPPEISKAIIAVEDERFASHHGIDIYGIGRALVKNILAMRIVEGGSTLTQQLAKNLFFTPERTLGRKAMEILAALSLEWHLGKREILEMYLNEVYLGQEGAVAIHGVAEAADTFFGKKLSELSLTESAMLAGMIKAPSYYSPRKHFKRTLERAQLVLTKMEELGLISPERFKAAMLEKPIILKRPLHERNASHYVMALNEELGRYFNVDAANLSGLKVYTGISSGMQRCAELALKSGLEKIEREHPAFKRRPEPLEAGLVAIEPHSGKIRAWVGSRDYSRNQFDHVLQAKRQVGSTIKAFLYLTALDKNLNDYKPANTLTILSDEPFKIDLVTRRSWIPENYDKEFHGDVTLRYALENSLNVPAAYIGQRVGINNLVRTLKSFRVSDSPPAVPALALGALDTTLLNLTAAYGALANGGIYTAPRIFISARDGENEPLATAKIFEERVADEAPVYVLTNILQGVVERGTGRAVRTAGFKGEVAGKTGTSNDTRDAWFVGYTPDVVAGVWVGLDDNSKLGLTGGVAAAPIWGNFMTCAAPYYESMGFIPPAGVVFLDVDPATGNLVSDECPAAASVREVFVRGTEPSCGSNPEGGFVRQREISREPDPTGEEASDSGFPKELENKRDKGIWDLLFR